MNSEHAELPTIVKETFRHTESKSAEPPLKVCDTTSIVYVVQKLLFKVTLRTVPKIWLSKTFPAVTKYWS